MEIKTIGYSSSLQISEGQWIKCWSEAELSPGDDFETCFQSLKDQVDEVQRKFSKPSYHPISEALGGVQVGKPEEKMIGVFEVDIASCTDLKTLTSYQLLVKGKPELQQVYDQRLKELSNGLEYH